MIKEFRNFINRGNVVELGVAETEFPIELLNVILGDQLYCNAPFAVIIIVSPKQIEVFGLEVTNGGELTSIGILAILEQPKLSIPKTL